MNLIVASLFSAVPFYFYVTDAARAGGHQTKTELQLVGHGGQLMQMYSDNRSASKLDPFSVCGVFWAAENVCKGGVVGVKFARAAATCADKGPGYACVKHGCVISKCCKILQATIKFGGEMVKLETAVEKAWSEGENSPAAQELLEYLDADEPRVDDEPWDPETQQQYESIQNIIMKDASNPLHNREDKVLVPDLRAEWRSSPELQLNAGLEEIEGGEGGMLQLNADWSHIKVNNAQRREGLFLMSAWAGFQATEYWCKGAKVGVKVAEIISDCWSREFHKCFLRLCMILNCCSVLRKTYQTLAAVEDLVQIEAKHFQDFEEQSIKNGVDQYDILTAGLDASPDDYPSDASPDDSAWRPDDVASLEDRLYLISEFDTGNLANASREETMKELMGMVPPDVLQKMSKGDVEIGWGWEGV